MNGKGVIFPGFLAGCLLSLLMVWSPALAQGGETRFRDDFNRAESKNVGNGWDTMPNVNNCPQPVKKKSPPPKVPKASTEDKTAESQRYAEISREIRKKAEQFQKKKGQESQEEREFIGTTARIQDGTLFFQYEQHQDAQMVQQDFSAKVVRLFYDFTPLYAMGGLHDRAWIGVRIYYLDADGLILGEIRNFYYQTLFEERENSDQIYTSVQKGLFDGTARHATIEAQKILNQRLKGVDQKRIVKTRVSFEVATGLCESSVEGSVDNVTITMETVDKPFQMTKELLLEMTTMGVEMFAKHSLGFPGNWQKALFEQYGQQNMVKWMHEIPPEVRGDLGRMTEFLMQRYQLAGKDAWLASYAVTRLLHVL